MESAHQHFAANSKRTRSSMQRQRRREKTIARATRGHARQKKVLGALSDLFFFQRQQAGGRAASVISLFKECHVQNFSPQLRQPRPDRSSTLLSSRRAAGFDWLARRSDTSICKTLPIALLFGRSESTNFVSLAWENCTKFDFSDETWKSALIQQWKCGC